MAVPIHYGTTPALSGTPEQYQQALGSAAATKVMVMQPGDIAEF